MGQMQGKQEKWSARRSSTSRFYTRVVLHGLTEKNGIVKVVLLNLEFFFTLRLHIFYLLQLGCFFGETVKFCG